MGRKKFEASGRKGRKGLQGQIEHIRQTSPHQDISGQETKRMHVHIHLKEDGWIRGSTKDETDDTGIIRPSLSARVYHPTENQTSKPRVSKAV